MTAAFNADHLFPKRNTDIVAAAVERNRLSVGLSDGSAYVFPAEWLRHNCCCSQCFNPNSLSYSSRLETLVYNDLILCQVSFTADAVLCTWSDGHESEYSATWLHVRRFTNEGKAERLNTIFGVDPVAWGDQGVVIQSATFSQVTETLEGFVKFGEFMIRDGIFLVTDSPDRPISVEFAEKTGCVLYPTAYGNEFHVESKPMPENLAYTPVKLELHIDQPYLDYCPKIQFLHCLVPSETGGENVMSDGIKAAKLLRDRNPDYYHILTTTLIDFEDLIAVPGLIHRYNAARKPVIVLGNDKEPKWIQWNQAVHSSFFNGSVDEYERWMEAMKFFYRILYECSITIKTKAGDILAFDNQRVMHGRNPYPSHEYRKLEGWYTDWDWVHAQLRVARIKNLQKTTEEVITC